MALNSKSALASGVTLGPFLHPLNRDNLNFCLKALKSQQVIDKFAHIFMKKLVEDTVSRELRKGNTLSTWSYDLKIRHT